MELSDARGNQEQKEPFYCNYIGKQRKKKLLSAGKRKIKISPLFMVVFLIGILIAAFCFLLFFQISSFTTKNEDLLQAVQNQTELLNILGRLTVKQYRLRQQLLNNLQNERFVTVDETANNSLSRNDGRLKQIRDYDIKL